VKVAGSHQIYNYSGPTTGKKQVVEEPYKDVVAEEPPPPTQVAPNALWNELDESRKLVKMEKNVMNDYVGHYLFARLKFIRGSGNGINLEYSTMKKSICTLVMTGCHQQHLAGGMLWWSVAKKQTINEIKRLRNDATKNMKTLFLGKYNHNRNTSSTECNY
jgi:hypothetical protein